MATGTISERAPRSKAYWYFFLLALANLIWAAQGIAVKYLDRHLGPVAITFLPFYVTTVSMVPLLIRLRRAHPGRAPITGGDWRSFIIAGVGGQVLAQLGMTWGISKSLASNGAILNLLIPVISAVLASAMLREKLTVLRWLSFAAGLIGVVLMSTEDLRQSSFSNSKLLIGNLLIFGGCCGSSFYNVYCKGLLRRFQEVEILIFSYIAASLASVPLLIWIEPLHLRAFQQFDTKSWMAFAFLAVLMYGASMLLFFYVLQFLDVTVASMSLYLVPVFGAVLAAVLLGERLSPLSLIGSAIVIIASVIAIIGERSQDG
jgi:drug/metabolite transporter (DMT)-like permease